MSWNEQVAKVASAWLTSCPMMSYPDKLFRTLESNDHRDTHFIQGVKTSEVEFPGASSLDLKNVCMAEYRQGDSRGCLGENWMVEYGAACTKG